MKTLDRYKLRNLERMVEKQRSKIRETAQECSSFAEVETYKMLLYSANKAYKAATTPAEKDWAYINQLSAVLEIKRGQGEDVSQGVRCVLPPEIVPSDAFPFGDRSL